MIGFCLDTGDLEMVKRAVGLYPVNCFSMNPSIAVNCLKGTDRSFLENARQIRKVIGREAPFYLEAMGDTAEEMLADARAIKEQISGNTLVKIPACPEGYKAIRLLKKEGIGCSCTAIYDFNQAMLAALAGAGCVAVYVSRLDNNGADGIETVAKIKRAFQMHGITDCSVSAASLKSPIYIEKAILAGADNVTVDLPMLEQMAVHPMTEGTLQKFKDDWEGLFGKGVRVANMEALS